MSRAPDWSEAEFTTLLSAPQATIAELHNVLPQRSEDAITLVRNALHQFHTTGSSPLLSQMMIRNLQSPSVAWTCPICQTTSRSA
jgi:hypothetical protein